MDLLEYLRVFRRRWRLLVGCVVVAGAAAWLTTPAEPSDDDVTYEATHQLLRDSSATAPQALATVSLYVKTGEVPRRVAERLDFDGEPALLAAEVTVEADEQVGNLDLTVTGSSAEEAAARANAFAEETLALLGEQASGQQQQQLERVNEELSTLQADIDALDAEIRAQAGEGNGILEERRDSKLRQYGASLDHQQQILNQPAPSAGYVSLQPALPELAEVQGGGFAAPTSRAGRTGLGLALGLLLGAGAVLIVERLDTRIHESGEAVTAFGLPVVAEVPLDRRRRERMVVTAAEPLSGQAEAYRSLRTALLLSPVTRLGHPGSPAPEGDASEPRVVLVTSAAPSEGKTTTAANLAVAMSETGRSVLVLSCDFRRPEIHRYFDRAGEPGIAELLTEGRTSDLEEVTRATLFPGVRLAAHGGTLRSFGDVATTGRELVTEARRLADVVIIDSPPMLATNDAAELVRATDAVVVVFRVGLTARSAAERTRFLLERLGASVAGLVAIGVPERSSTSYSSYYSREDDSSETSSDAPGKHSANGGRHRAGRRRVAAVERATPAEPAPSVREDDGELAEQTRTRLTRSTRSGLNAPGDTSEGPELDRPG